VPAKRLPIITHDARGQRFRMSPEYLMPVAMMATSVPFAALELPNGG